MSATVQQCTSCQTILFPFRLFCPACGQSEFADHELDRGAVEETTVLTDGTVLATVASAGGTRLIARIVGGEASRGETVHLSNQANGQRGVFAYVPFSREDSF